MQKYISRTSDGNLEKFVTGLSRTAIEEGLEDARELRRDGMAIEANMHSPANNSLMHDRIKESGRLPGHLKEETNGFSYEEYKAKRTYFKINVEKDEGKRAKLFKKQLKLFIASISQASNTVEKSPNWERRQRRRHVLTNLKSCAP